VGVCSGGSAGRQSAAMVAGGGLGYSGCQGRRASVWGSRGASR